MEVFEGYIEVKRNVAIGEQGVLIKQEDFNNYSHQFGNEKALAYLQAMNDFTAYAEVILGGGYCRSGIQRSAYTVKKNLIELVNHNRKFLNNIAANTDLKFDL